MYLEGTEETLSQDDSNAVGVRTACPVDAVNVILRCGVRSSSKERKEDR
jgi:hypothetical protein